MAHGILAYGAWLPRLRLSRQAVVAANAWFNPGLAANRKGERAMANWDEDAITMAVEAGRDCLRGFAAGQVGALHVASTTFPYDDRQNSVIVAEALGLPPALLAMDVAGSQRAGTTALLAALRGGGAGHGGGAASHTLVIAADHRKARAGSVQELAYGDGAAALLVGDGAPIAMVLGAHAEALDFIDHHRGHGREFDYAWEERWVRDEGHMKLLPRGIAALLEKTGADPASIAHLCLPGVPARTAQAVAAQCGIRAEAVRDNLALNCGDTGAAHGLLLLAHALEQAMPGERILVASFGQGCDALLVEVTEQIALLPPRAGVTGALARRKPEAHYPRYLAFNELVELERGMRAEVDRATALSAHTRHHAMVLGLVGGRCRQCGTPQFPRSQACVNPACQAFGAQDPYRFADLTGSVMSYTSDMLTYCPDPPQHYGMIEFADGGRLMADFTDVAQGEVEVGMAMRMMFRIKDQDALRGFTRYFWKAAPLAARAGEAA